MKPLDLIRRNTALQGGIASNHENIQQSEPMNRVSIAMADDAFVGRPRLLAQRNARQARRLAH